MTTVFGDTSAVWAAVMIVVLPLVIIGMGELEERLRQRDSAHQRSVSIVRTWVLPLLAVWALAQVLFDPADDNPLVGVLGSALVIAASAAVLSSLATVVAAVRDRPRAEGRRPVPRLVLAMPRLVVLLTTGWLLLSGVWNVDLSAALTALGVTSLVVSFALQDTLSGIASGFTLLADQPFQPGDWIRAGDVEGRVVDINWRSSRIRTRDGDLVIVPNGQLASGTITNYDEPVRLHRIVFPLQVAYANAPTRAKEMLLAAARATPGVLTTPEPSVLVVQVDDPLMGYEVHMWVEDYAIVPAVRSAFGSLVWYHSHRYDVPLPSPAQDLFLWDGERNAAGGRRDEASLAAGLRSSPLLAELGDEELHALAGGATAAHFAEGETVLPDGSDQLVLVEEGRARLEVVGPGGQALPVADIGEGEIVGVLGLEAPPGSTISVVAQGDCRVIELAPDVAGAVISRSPALSAAMDQLATSRRGRIRRTLRRTAEHDQRPLEPDGAGPEDPDVLPSGGDRGVDTARPLGVHGDQPTGGDRADRP